MTAYAGRSQPQLSEDTPEARLRLATPLAHKHGGITVAASALISPTPAPRNGSTFELLRRKLLTVDHAAIAACKSTISGEAQDYSATLQGTIREVYEPLCLEDARVVIKKMHRARRARPVCTEAISKAR